MRFNLPQKNSIKVLVIHAEETVPPQLLTDSGIDGHTFNLEFVQVGKLDTIKRKARIFKTDAILYHGDLTLAAHLEYVFDLLRTDLFPPIIVVTQRGSHAIANEVLEAGADDYFELNTCPRLSIQLPFAIRKAVRQSKLETHCHHSLETADRAQQTKHDFMAVMSHEVRTPMNSIIGFTDLLLDSPEDEAQRDYLEIIKGNAYSLLEIMNNVLTYSRLDSTTVELEEREADIALLLEDVRETFAEETQRKGLTVNIHIPQDLPTEVITNYGELRHAILNLVGNAVKFTAAGSIDIELHGYCNCEGKNQNQTRWTYMCSVKDTGIGIPKEEQENIFQLFKQIDSTSTRKYGGTGLGLAICRKIAEILKGEIWLESQPGKGSTFHFSFQASLTNVETRHTYSLENHLNNRHTFAKTTPLKIILGQPNNKHRAHLEGILKQMGYAYTVVETGLDVLQTIHRDSFDLVLIDANIPQLSGMETTQLIRQGQGGIHNRSLYICVLSDDPQRIYNPQKHDGIFNACLPTSTDVAQCSSMLIKAAQHMAKRGMRKAG